MDCKTQLHVLAIAIAILCGVSAILAIVIAIKQKQKTESYNKNNNRFAIEVVDNTVFLYDRGYIIDKFPVQLSRRGRICVQYKQDWLIFDQQRLS